MRNRQGSGRGDAPEGSEFWLGARVRMGARVTYTGNPAVARKPGAVTRVHLSEDPGLAHEYTAHTDDSDKVHVYSSEFERR